MILRGKKVILIGERDGVPSDALALCAESAGATVVYASTECFV
jgi:betaine reductase